MFTADEFDIDGSGMGISSGSGDIPDDLEEGDDDDPSGRIKVDRRPPIIPSTPTTGHGGFNPSRPRFPLRPAPPILIPHGNNNNGQDGNESEDDDGDDDDDDEDGNVRNWNIGPPNFNRPTSGGGISMGGGGSDIDFAPPGPPPRGPPSLSPVVPFTKPTTTSTTTSTSTTTTTTRKPAGGNDHDVRKTTVNSGHGGDASSAIAVFKLFSPIIVSMIGKVFSFS